MGEVAIIQIRVHLFVAATPASPLIPKGDAGVAATSHLRYKVLFYRSAVGYNPITMTLAATTSTATASTPTPSTSARIISPGELLRDRMSIVPITIEQYQQMIEQGIVPEDSTVELIRGMLVRKDRSVQGEDPMGHSPLHKAIVAMLTHLAGRIDSEHCHLQIQLPILIPPDSNPEPDGAIIRGTARDYLDRMAGPADILCVIEVAHSSLERDREDKLPLYAGANIPQYVIIDLRSRTLEVHTDPDPQNQQYRTKVTLTVADTLKLMLPNASLDVPAREILP